MAMRALLLVFVAALVAGCSRGSELVGVWRTTDKTVTVTMVLLNDRTGDFTLVSDETNATAPIKKWWLDGQIFRFVNVKDVEQNWKLIVVEPNMLTVEEPLGSGHVSVYKRVQ